MAAPTTAAEQLQPPKPPQNHHRKSGGGRGLFYFVVVFVVCWLQLSINVSVFFWTHKLPNSSPRIAGRFPAFVPHGGGGQGGGGQASSSTAAGGNHLRGGSSDITGGGHPPSVDTPSSLEAQLLNLRTRLETVKNTLEEEIRIREESSFASSFTDNGGGGFLEKGASLFSSEKRKVFVPFTIRDAQRTVPIQIPHGFEVFDLVDVYATNGDQNQTAYREAYKQKKKNSVGNNNTATAMEKRKPSHEEFDTPTSEARLFLNGKHVIEGDRQFGDHKHNDDDDCQGYSKQCYRSKFLKVIRYLLAHQRNDGGDNNIEYYYFYMESDNDLCVPLSDIRDLAFEYQRYFVSTGIGASGWIMSQTFLEDFYEFWTILGTSPTTSQTQMHGLSETQLLEPDSVAAVLLREKKAWSVTRQYLTSHSILVGNTEDQASIKALFVPLPPSANKTEEHPQQDASKTTKKAHKKETPEEAGLKAPPLEPSRYLPRCREPHRGVWRDATNPDSGTDVELWGYFDYDQCPESDIFPCEEGQLDVVAR